MWSSAPVWWPGPCVVTCVVACPCVVAGPLYGDWALVWWPGPYVVAGRLCLVTCVVAGRLCVVTCLVTSVVICVATGPPCGDWAPF